MRTGVRAVEGTGLENRRAGNGTVGSNPTLSVRELMRWIRAPQRRRRPVRQTTGGRPSGTGSVARRGKPENFLLTEDGQTMLAELGAHEA